METTGSFPTCGRSSSTPPTPASSPSSIASCSATLPSWRRAAAAGAPDANGQEWLVICDPHGTTRIAFQQVSTLPASTWPADGVPQQLHLDMSVASVEALNVQHERATSLGARLLLDRSDDQQEPLRVYADPAGHPFCIFVAPA